MIRFTSVSFNIFLLSFSNSYFYVVQCAILRDYSKTYARSKYYDEAKPWNERCDVAFPCAYHNEIDQADAINLISSGCRILIEGSKHTFSFYFHLSLRLYFIYLLVFLFIFLLM